MNGNPESLLSSKLNKVVSRNSETKTLYKREFTYHSYIWLPFFKIVRWCMDIQLPALLPSLQSVMEVCCPKHVKHLPQCVLNLIGGVKTVTPQLESHLREREEISGSRIQWLGWSNHHVVAGAKHMSFERCVSDCNVCDELAYCQHDTVKVFCAE